MNTPASAAEVSFVRGASDKRELAANQCDIRNRFIALLPSPPSLTIERTRLAGGSIWFSSCKRVSAFLALFRKLLSAFFGVNENVVRITEMLFPFVPDFSVMAPLVKLKLMQVFKKLLIEFGLQFKGKTGEQFCCFGFE